MQLDDLLGLLFLFFFVILPAIQGFMRRGRQMPDDFEPDNIPLPDEGKAKPSTGPAPAQSAQPAQSSAPAPSRPPSSAPPPRPAPAPVSPTGSRTPSPPPRPSQPQQPRVGKTLEQIERERLARQVQNQPPPQPSRPAQPQPRVAPPAAVQRRQGEHWEFSSTPHDIVNGIVWNQILSEPRSQYWRTRRKPRR